MKLIKTLGHVLEEEEDDDEQNRNLFLLVTFIMHLHLNGRVARQGSPKPPLLEGGQLTS